MAAKFGTSGLRGLVEDLTDGTAARHVRAFIRHMQQKGALEAGGVVLAARDRRPSSPLLLAQAAEAARGEGARLIDCGLIPTPALALEAMRLGVPALMMTGSHIPADRNGLKFYRPDGEIDKDDEQAIGQGARTFTDGETRGMAADHDNGVTLAGFLARYAPFCATRPFSGLKVGVYAHSTVASQVLADILSEAGARVTVFGEAEGFIPVDTEAVSDETRTLAKAAVRDYSLDAVVSADGDGDRPLVCDESGTVVRGDALGLLAARFTGADAVVTPVSSNSGIEAALPGASVQRTRIGSPFVIEGLEKAKAGGARRIIGFEANGGVLTASPLAAGNAMLQPLPTRDCVLPILAVLGETVKAGQTVSETVRALDLPAAVSGRIENFAQERSAQLIALLDNRAKAEAFFTPFGKIVAEDRTDGIRVSLEGRRIIHIRPSGNAPELRIYTEARNEDEATRLVDQAQDAILRTV